RVSVRRKLLTPPENQFFEKPAKGAMKVRVKLFSIAKDLAGFEETVVEIPSGSSAEIVLDQLIARNPRFVDWKPSLRLAVNQEYVRNEHLLSENDEVAVIPPVSGG
ncbi:MAG: molybdopterin converting factor subunit 1, partial [Bacteroidota bacterium]